jgi:hypothetical protein
MKEMEWFDITEKEARWHPALFILFQEPCIISSGNLIVIEFGC